MAIENLGKTQIRKPDYQEPRWDVPLNESWEAIAAMLETLVTGTRWVSGLDYQFDGGLNFTLSAGIINRAGVDENISGASTSVDDGTTQYVYVNSGGTITVGNTFEDTNICPLYMIQSSQGAIVSVGDLRNKQVASGGGGGGGLEWQAPASSVVMDNDFSDPGYWSTTTGASVADGKGKADGTASDMYIFKAGILENGKTYNASLKVDSNDGAVRITGSDGATYPFYLSMISGDIGTLSGEFLVADQDVNDFVCIRFDANTTAEVDDFFIYEVGFVIQAQSGKGYPLQFGQTLQLPASPNLNDQIGYKDYLNEFNDRPCFIDPNGNPIENIGTGLMELNSRGQGGVLVWVEDRWLLVDVTELGDTGVSNKPFMHVQDQKPSGTSGGTNVAGYNDRDLNTILANDISGASLANNLITLPAGTYFVDAQSPSYGTGYCRTEVRKADDTILVRSTAGYPRTSTPTQPVPRSQGRFTLAEATDIKVVTWTNSVFSSTGLGLATSESGTQEVFSEILIWKLDSDIDTPVLSDPTMTLARPLLHAREQQPAGTDGGSSVAGWNERALNTIMVNEIPGASLVSNVISLPAGTYHVEATAPSIGGGTKNRLFIRNDADSKLIAGPTCYDGGAGEGDLATLSGRLVLTQATSIKISHNVATTRATTGLGDASGVDPEVYAEIRIWQLDALVRTPVLVNDKLFPLPGNVQVTGNMYGLDYAKTGANEVTIQPGACMNSTNEVALQLASAQALSIPAAASTIYNLFLCDDGFVRQDTDENGAGLVGYKVRWLGFVRNNAGGTICGFAQNGEHMSSSLASENIVASLGTSFAQIDHSAFLPVSRIKAIDYGGKSTSSDGRVLFSHDGVNNAGLVCLGDTATNDTSLGAWNRDADGKGGALTAFVNNIYARGTTAGSLLIHQVLLKR